MSAASAWNKRHSNAQLPGRPIIVLLELTETVMSSNNVAFITTTPGSGEDTAAMNSWSV